MNCSSRIEDPAMPKQNRMSATFIRIFSRSASTSCQKENTQTMDTNSVSDVIIAIAFLGGGPSFSAMSAKGAAIANFSASDPNWRKSASVSLNSVSPVLKIGPSFAVWAKSKRCRLSDLEIAFLRAIQFRRPVRTIVVTTYHLIVSVEKVIPLIV